MAETDIAVRRGGKTFRLVTKGESAGLFDRSGLVEVLTVDVPATAPMRMPSLSSAGEPLSLAKASKPCSCTGAPWNQSAADLRAQLS